MDLWIGTAGYSYPAWVGGFYPPGTKSADYLPTYARHFPVVEINSTFYRPPTVDQVARMADKVPAGFRFSLKVPKTASHEYDPTDLPAIRRAAGRFADDGKLIGLVIQFAESFRNLPSNREWLTRVRGELRPYSLAVEFRHRSWDMPALPGWLARRGLDVVSVGVPDLPQLFPAGPRVLGEQFYARLHSQNPSNWYAGGPARYDFDYPEDSLRLWADGLRAVAATGTKQAVVFFNNCIGVQAVENAKRLGELVWATVPGVRVVPPAVPMKERTLFDDLG